MTDILAITAPVFFIILTGYIFARFGFFQANAQKAFSLYVFYCAMPCYLFLSMAKSNPETIVNFHYISAFAIGLFISALLSWFLASKIFKRRQDESIVAMMSGCYTNSAFIGIPIIVMTFGHIGPAVSVTLFQLVIVTTFILTSLETINRNNKLSFKIIYDLPKTILITPLISATLLGIIFSFMSWPVPKIIDSAFGLLGNAGIPTALFALGLSLANRKPSSTTRQPQLIYSLVIIKNIIHPLIAGLIGYYIFQLPEMWLGALIVVSAMPTAVNNFIFAERYSAFENESSQVVFLSSLTSLFTLSAILWWLTA